MWIIPKSITCPSVLDMGESTLDSEQFSQIAEQSLMWRSKPSLQRTWLRRWKRESWIRHLSIRTLDPSHSSTFAEWWTYSLEVSRANHSAMPGSVTGWTILGTSGPPLPKESEPADQQLSFSRTSMESHQQSHRDTTAFSTMSSVTWKKWVTEQRQDALARRKSALLTLERDGSSSAWPTPTGIHADRGNHDEPVENYQKRKRVKDYEEGRAKGKPGKSLGVAVNWPTASARGWKDSPGMSTSRKDRPGQARKADQLPRAVYAEECGEESCGQQSVRDSRKKHGAPVDLTTASAPAQDQHKTDGCTETEMERNCGHDQNSPGPRDQEKGNTNGNRPGLLNPAWVETLMGLPFGWTDLGSWVMESSPKPEQKHS